MKDMRHHLGRIQREVIRSARREAAEAALKDQKRPINGHETQNSRTSPPKFPAIAA